METDGGGSDCDNGPFPRCNRLVLLYVIVNLPSRESRLASLLSGWSEAMEAAISLVVGNQRIVPNKSRVSEIRYMQQRTRTC